MWNCKFEHKASKLRALPFKTHHRLLAITSQSYTIQKTFSSLSVETSNNNSWVWEGCWRLFQPSSYRIVSLHDIFSCALQGIPTSHSAIFHCLLQHGVHHPRLHPAFRFNHGPHFSRDHLPTPVGISIEGTSLTSIEDTRALSYKPLRFKHSEVSYTLTEFLTLQVSKPLSHNLSATLPITLQTMLQT